MPLRCLLVDDNGAYLEAASLLLEREGVSVVGAASSIAEALRQSRALRADFILVDIGLGALILAAPRLTPHRDTGTNAAIGAL
jgi:CheY-like chemotaxis protein